MILPQGDHQEFEQLVEFAARHAREIFLVLIGDEISANDYKRAIRTGGADWVAVNADPAEVVRDYCLGGGSSPPVRLRALRGIRAPGQLRYRLFQVPAESATPRSFWKLRCSSSRTKRRSSKEYASSILISKPVTFATMSTASPIENSRSIQRARTPGRSICSISYRTHLEMEV